MKSSVSPTTSAAVSPITAADAPPENEVAAFESLLVPIVLKPLADTLGPLGATFGDALARALIGDTSGQTDR